MESILSNSKTSQQEGALVTVAAAGPKSCI
jgi:hypothetical protein